MDEHDTAHIGQPVEVTVATVNGALSLQEHFRLLQLLVVTVKV